MQIYNVHSHIFSINDVPDNFLPFGLVRFLARHPITRDLAFFIHNLFPNSDDDIIYRYLQFVNIGIIGGQKEIFENLRRFYPENTVFVILPMDMEYMGAGKVAQDYPVQLEELANLKREYPEKIIPFVAVDPRRPDITELAIKYIEKYDFGGVKIYPALGYYPYDSRLYKLYEYLQSHHLPVTAHTAPTGLYYKGKLTMEMFEHFKDKVGKPKAAELQNNQAACAYFSHPVNYEYVLADFPDVKINLAHCGGNTEWHDHLYNPPFPGIPTQNWYSIILAMVRRYKTLYTDIAYVLNDPKLLPLLKVLLQDDTVKDKILFGSDYYMVQMDVSEKGFSIDLRGYLGENDYQRITEFNPKRFLDKTN